MISFLHPWLLWGSLAVAAPILIHLLSRRRHRVVDWAAMEFLLEADRRNRRRLRLEDLLLLLLRCLAVLLLALLVARPFIRPDSSIAASITPGSIERVFLLDDSPSMTAADDGRSSLDRAFEGLARTLRQIQRQHPGDRLTLFLTSQPDRAMLNAVPLADVEAAIRTLQSLKPSDFTARLDHAFLSLEALLKTRSVGPRDRTLAVLTDLRRPDWPLSGEGAAPTPGSAADVPALLASLASHFADTQVIDLAGARTDNLAITGIRSLDSATLAGVDNRFEVQVFNSGDEPARDVEVSLTIGTGTPLRAAVSAVEPGQTAAAVFTCRFREAGSYQLHAELPPDVLAADNQRGHAVQVRPGRDVLMVEGDADAADNRSAASVFLRFAVAPPGEVASGNTVEVLHEQQFEGLALDRYSLAFLCNLDQLTEDRVTALEQWVAQGGGLVLLLGDQVDAGSFNQRLHRDGAGLSPLALTEHKGDPSQRQWVQLSPQDLTHPAMRVFEGDNNPFLREVKFYQWWGSVLPESAVAATRVIARLSDIGEGQAAGSIAMAERAFGKGRVLVVTTGAGGQWTNWPADPSYVILTQEIVRTLAKPVPEAGSGAVGSVLRYEIDPAVFLSQATVTIPEGEPVAVTAVASSDHRRLRFEFPTPAAASAAVEESAMRSEETARAGFYRLTLRRHDQQEHAVWFAINIDPAEGDLRRADLPAIRQRLDPAGVRVTPVAAWMAETSPGAGRELWRPVLLVLILALAAESVLAWALGRRRS